MTPHPNTTSPLDLDALCRAHREWTAQWHEQPDAPLPGAPWLFLQTNHRMNFDLWHEEDIARRDDLGPERVREAKRAIDRFNQRRNDAIEQIDVWLLEQLPPPQPGAPRHSETPGMIIDRLSILSLKLFHMRIEAARDTATPEHRAKCAARCQVLEEQSADLRASLAELFGELTQGTRCFKLYRQLKMYNDAALNPQLYAKNPAPQ